MKGEIFSIGHELLMGEITDTNASYLASQMPALGITLHWISQIGDDMADLTDAFSRALKRSDVIITTGGLGPTQDDLTREAIAQVLGEELKPDLAVVEELKKWFRGRGMEMPPRNIKQANLIPSSQAIPNNQGTAPGWWVEKDGKTIICMPGPPGEMKNMWTTLVAPRLRERAKGIIIISRNIKTTDMSEAEVAEKVSKYFGMENPYLGIYAKHDGIHLRIICRGTSEVEARGMIKPVEEGIAAIMGSYIWGYDDETPEEAVGKMLKERGLTLAAMESCSGGMLADTITNVPGSSQYFKGGIVSYTNEAKIAAGVPSEIIERYGAISVETAEAMAQAARNLLRADIGVGITGVAGPSEMEGKPVGTVFGAVSMDGKVKGISLRLPPRRYLVKYRSVNSVLVALQKLLKES
jgi:nicotinamide-nucleotide amidase